MEGFFDGGGDPVKFFVATVAGRTSYLN